MQASHGRRRSGSQSFFPTVAVVITALLSGTAGAQTPPGEATQDPWPPPNAAPAQDATTTLSMKDRVALDAALTALTAQNFPLARQILSQLLVQAESAEARTTASVVLDRLNEWQHRQVNGLVSPFSEPPPTSPISPFPSPPPARQPARQATGETSARTPFLVTTTLLGLAAWGPTLPLMLDVDTDDGRGFVGLYMLTAGSSFLVPYWLTGTKKPTPAQANLAFYGGTRGLEWGLLVSNLLFGKAGGDTNEHERAFAASLFVGSVAGLTAGTWVAGRYGYTAGQARTVAVLGDYGLFAGLLSAHILGLNDLGTEMPGPFGENFLSESDRDKRARATSAAGIVGTVAGLVGGRWLSLRRDNTWGDGEVMRASTVLGALTATTIGVTANLDDKNDRALAAMALAGGGAGLIAGDWFVQHENFSPGQAILVDLAGVAGALLGLGGTYLVAPDLSEGPFMIAATVGAATGGGLVAYLASRGAADIARGETAPTLAIVPSLPSGDRGDLGVRLLGRF